jgi:hypothetical protein
MTGQSGLARIAVSDREHAAQRRIIQIVRNPHYLGRQSMIFENRCVWSLVTAGRDTMTKDEYVAKVNEVDRLLNDPTVSLDPMRIWSLLSELAGATAFDVGLHDACASPRTSIAQGDVS